MFGDQRGQTRWTVFVKTQHYITTRKKSTVKKLLYEEGYRFIVKYELLGEVYLCIDFPPPKQPFVEIEELKRFG